MYVFIVWFIQNVHIYNLRIHYKSWLVIFWQKMVRLETTVLIKRLMNVMHYYHYHFEYWAW